MSTLMQEGSWNGDGQQQTDIVPAHPALPGILRGYERRADLLLPVLQDVQVRLGYIPRETLPYIAQYLGVPQSRVHSVVGFYDLFTDKPGPKTIHLCDDVGCYLAGSAEVRLAVEDMLGVGPGETTDDAAFTYKLSPCLGGCHRGPGMLVDNAPVFELTADRARRAIAAARDKTPELEPVAGIRTPQAERVVLSNVEVIDPTSLADYVARGGFQALRKALAKGAPWVIGEIKDSGLVGQGGAAFPTGLKWEFGAKAIAAACPAVAGPRGYVVCNCDESETGTFKDRLLLGGDPLRVVEGLMLAAFASGAQHGYVYIRWEYPMAYRNLQKALSQARAGGYLGSHILGSDFSFDVEVRRGASAYVCGEETALFESIEGKRGESRSKPPFPTNVGLFGKPTVINNVETLAKAALIVDKGAQWFRSYGTEKSPGTKLFCLSGRVERPGLYEAPLGITMRHLLYDLAGGIRGGHKLAAVLCGGASGSFVSPEQIDVGMDFQSLAAIGSTLGSGAVMVIDDTVSLWEVMRRVARFFMRESCGKCFPCQIGTRRQAELVTKLSEGKGGARDVAMLHELAAVMRDTSNCGLGQAAPNAILSGLKLLGY